MVFVVWGSFVLWGFFNYYFCLFLFCFFGVLRKNAFLDLRTVFNEAISMLDELQNPGSLAYVDTLSF